MIPTNYVPIVKTGNAELKGLEELEKNIKERITPLVEITRYRKVTKKNKETGQPITYHLPIYKRMEQFGKAFGTEQSFILDITGDENLSNDEINELQSSENGFQNWCYFLSHAQKDFPNIIPTIQALESEGETLEEFNENFKKEILFLDANFQNMVFRFPHSDPYYLDDLTTIENTIPGISKKIICVIDLEFLPQGFGDPAMPSICQIIKDIFNKFGINEFVVAGTSFPKSVSEYSAEDSAIFNLEEVVLFKKLRSIIPPACRLVFGDYACINPSRNDVKAKAWIPRIDCPQEEKMFYHRSRKGESGYAAAYKRVAKIMIADPKYVETKNILGQDNWGIKKIEDAASNIVSSSLPSFWISVRLNMAITLRCLQLG